MLKYCLETFLASRGKILNDSFGPEIAFKKFVLNFLNKITCFSTTCYWQSVTCSIHLELFCFKNKFLLSSFVYFSQIIKTKWCRQTLNNSEPDLISEISRYYYLFEIFFIQVLSSYIYNRFL